MEAIVERIVEKCIQSELIEESQRDWMAYSLQRKFMNFGGFFILVCFGTLVAPLPQVILLNLGWHFYEKRQMAFICQQCFPALSPLYFVNMPAYI